MNYTKFKDLCKAKGLSATYISTKLGKSRNYFIHCNNRGTKIPDEYLKIIAEMLNTTVAYLNDETDDPTPNDAELTEILETLRNDPNRRMLFHTLEGCTKEDILQAVKIIEALKK